MVTKYSTFEATTYICSSSSETCSSTNLHVWHRKYDLIFCGHDSNLYRWFNLNCCFNPSVSGFELSRDFSTSYWFETCMFLKLIKFRGLLTLNTVSVPQGFKILKIGDTYPYARPFLNGLVARQSEEAAIPVPVRREGQFCFIQNHVLCTVL